MYIWSFGLLTAKGRHLLSAGDHVTIPEFGQSSGQSQGTIHVKHEKYSIVSWKLQTLSELSLGR